MRAIDFQAADRRIQELIRRDRLPNVSVCVSGPDGVVFEKGYGYRDRDFTLPVDPDTVFGIASMSKSITALAIAILECEGKLSYDDPVSKYFPDFSVPGAPKDMVTLRTLARHTAGIPPMEPLEWSIAMAGTANGFGTCALRRRIRWTGSNKSLIISPAALIPR